MFTQCPDCGVAFRVTAEVLKMAAGKVRCGGCGVAFNALEHLSEEKPTARESSGRAPNPDLPELTPDEPVELEADTPPETISAEQSAALLKTLDQLAGEDIRIEDTGVEWRVLDEDEEADIEEADEPESELIADTGSLKFIIESEEDAAAGEPEMTAGSEPSQFIDEMRFDDNTVLPDDFDDVVDVPSSVAPPEPATEPEPRPEPPQIDLELSQPDEWDDLLGDLGDVEEEPEPDFEPEPEPELQAEEAQPEPVAAETEELLDMDTQFAIQAEAMGIDLSGIHETAGEDEEEPEESPGEEAEDELETSIEEDLMAAAFEAEAAEQKLEETASEEALELDEDGDEEQTEDEEAGEAADEPENLEIDLQNLEEEEIEDDVDDIALGFDDKVEQDIATLSLSLDEDEEEDEEKAEEPVDVIPTLDDEHVIPEMTEEEKTINMMIDQELFNIAVEDEDGFASTIVQLQPDDKVDEEIEENKEKSSKKGKKDKKAKTDQKKDKEAVKEKQPQLAVETIIMEGEFVRGELDKERLAADKTAKPESVSDGGLSIPINREKDDYARRREMTSGPSGMGVYAGIGALVLLLLLQVMHQSREALATIPAFNSAVGPIYRMLGQPLTPTWNVAGWRFERTKGDLDELGETLTIYTEVGNDSGEALPYPLVLLSLTDRLADVVGSTLLEPADYLPENADPRKLVPPGENFSAVVSIDSPPENIFGYELEVCYRLADGLLRCKDFDFK